MKLVRVGRDTVPRELPEPRISPRWGSIGPGERVLVENPGIDFRPGDVQPVYSAGYTARVERPVYSRSHPPVQFY